MRSPFRSPVESRPSSTNPSEKGAADTGDLLRSSPRDEKNLSYSPPPGLQRAVERGHVAGSSIERKTGSVIQGVGSGVRTSRTPPPSRLARSVDHISYRSVQKQSTRY